MSSVENDAGESFSSRMRARLGVASLYMAFIGIALFAFVKMEAPSRDAVALYLEEETGHRVIDESPSSFLLDAHFVLMPAGREKARRLEAEAVKIEFRMLSECVEAAPRCSLTAQQFERLRALQDSPPFQR